MSLKVLLNNSNLYKHLVDKVNDKQKEKKDRENLILISRFWDFNAKFNKDKNNNFTHKKRHFLVKDSSKYNIFTETPHNFRYLKIYLGF